MTKLAASLTTRKTHLTNSLTARLNRAGRRDAGNLLEYVIIAGGVCVIAIGLVVLLRTVIGRYEANIK